MSIIPASLPPILPDYQPHQDLERDVRSFLMSLGYLTPSAAYHDVMSSEAVRALQFNYCPTALYLRSRADRIAVHRTEQIAFEWEIKTHKSEKRHDLTIESLPICHHIAKSRLGVECLYAFRNPIRGYEGGFWIRDMPKVRCIMIPNRWDTDKINWYRSVFEEWMPETDIITIGNTRGTGDPFLIIDERIVAQLDDWRQLIKGFTEDNDQQSATMVQPEPFDLSIQKTAGTSVWWPDGPPPGY